MLHPTKSQSLLQWFNAMVTKGAIQSLGELSDGLQFYELVSIINAIRKGKIPGESLSSCDNLANDSNTSLSSTIQAETKSNDESNAEANSSETEMVADDGASEKCEETESNVFSSEKERNDAEVEKRFEEIKELIDDIFKLDSSSLITYSDCIEGKELELAKVAVLLLTYLVNSYLSAANVQVDTAYLLEDQVQEDIKECMTLVLQSLTNDGPLKKAELHKILSRPSKSKGTPRRKTPSRATPEISETPEMPKKRRDRTIYEEVYESPLKTYLASPQIQYQASVIRKNAEVFKLTAELVEAEGKVNKIDLEKKALTDELEKTKKDLDRYKEQYRKLQDSANEVDDSKREKMDEMLKEKERDKKEILTLTEDLDFEKKENEKLLKENDLLKEELSQKVSKREYDEEKKKVEKLEDEKRELELNIQMKEDKFRALREEFQRKEDSKTSDSNKTSRNSYENLSSIIYIDERTAQEDLSAMKEVCDELRSRLDVEIKKSEEYERLIKSSEDELNKEKGENLNLNLKLENVTSDLDKAEKQISVYESWQKSLEKNESTSSRIDETYSGNPPPPFCWQSPSSDGLERERIVKEEPELGKLWDTCSGKSIETRSRSASALGYNRDSYGDSTFSCSASDFENLKKGARAIAKLLKKKSDSAEAQHLAHLEEKARCLGSVKDLCDFYHSVQESLKSLKIAMFSVPEIPSKRKGRSQTVEETDSNIAFLESRIKKVESELECKKQEMKNLEKEMTEKDKKLLVDETAYLQLTGQSEKLKTEIKALNDEVKKRQQEATDANIKYEYAKKHIEQINHVNKKLQKACDFLKAEARPKVEPCKDCDLLREKLSDVKQDRNEFEKDSFELRIIVRDLESKINNLERQLKNEIKERKKLEFQIQRESAFLSGSMSERNAVIHRYFQEGLAESKRAKIQAEKERKSLIEDKEKPQQVYSFNTYIVNHDNRDSCPEHSMSNVNAYANRSIRSGFLQTDDEEDFLNHSSLAQIQRDVFPEPEDGNRRLTEIQRRNTLCRPHLQSSYPLELQNMTPTERKYRAPVQPYRRALQSAPEAAESVNDSEDSQDVQHLPLRKRKGPEIQKSVQPMKKAVRTSSQARLIQRVKPVTPVRKTGFISKTKTFKTPTSIRRLMRMSQKK